MRLLIAKNYWRLLLVVLSLSVSASLSSADSFRYVVDNRLGQAVPPYSWYNQCTKTYRGLHAQLFQHFAHKLGLQAEIVEAELAWGAEGIMEQAWLPLSEGRADFAMSLPSMVKLDNQMIFSEERVMVFHPVLLLPVNGSDVSSIKDLEPLLGVSVKSGGMPSYMSRMGFELKQLRFNSMDESILALAEGKGDYWITDKYLANHLIDTLGLKDKIKFSNVDLGLSADIHIMARNNADNTLVLKEIDRLLKPYKDNEFIDYFMHSVMRSWVADKKCVKLK